MNGFISALSTIIFIFSTSVNAKQNKEEKRHYVIHEEYLKFLPQFKNLNPLAKEKNLVLTQLSIKELEMLSLSIHEKKNVCGGFFDVEEEIKSNISKTKILKSYSFPKTFIGRQENYEIKYPVQTQATVDLAHETRFYEFFQKIVAFPNRFSRSAQGVIAINWLKGELEHYTKETKRADLNFSFVASPQGYPQPSLVVKIPGKDSSLPGVLIGGHYDTFNGTKPGADDDASGSATVAEIFRAVMDSKLKFKRDLYFAFYGAEEYGLLGSREVVRDFKKRKISLRGVLQFDMTGFNPSANTKDIYLIRDYTQDNLTEFLRQLSYTYLKFKPEQVGNTECGYACSDHASWHREGYPAAFPFETDSGDYNPHIHTEKDTLDRLDIRHAMNFVRLGAAFAVELAEPID